MAVDMEARGMGTAARSGASRVRVQLSLPMVCALAAAVLAVVAYFLPLWHMTLVAPQYPQDLNLTAYGTDMVGDLEEINTLNQYTGVKEIVPDDVTELKLFPFLLAGFVALLVVSAFVQRRWVRWLAVLIAWGFVIGFLIDLQYWLYAYGHDLNEEAPLYPGPFTPRVLGPTKIVNFHSKTMVGTGWWLLFIAAVLITFGPMTIRFLRDSWRNTGTSRVATTAGLLLAAFAVAAAARPTGAHAAAEGDLAALISAAAPGSTVTVPAGHYAGPVVIDKPITLVGVGWPVIDGLRKGDVVTITAEGVTLRGFVIQGSGREVSDEPSGVRVSADRATIEGNRLRDVLYGIFLHDSNGHTVRGNDIQSVREFSAERRGHALYLYYTTDNALTDNVISYAKDGVYINFSERNQVLRNRVTNLRYGIHFMYANDSQIVGNVFRDNLTGGSVMYSHDLLFERNEFSYNRSPASGYGLVFKDVDNITLDHDSIHHNHIGLTMEGAPLNPDKTVVIRDTLVGFNQVALFLSTTVGARFSGNTFVGNLQQVETKGGSLEHHNVWNDGGRGNYWDDYRGYDANGDGSGDITYQYRAAYGELIQDDEGLKAYANTPAQMAIDLAARWFPAYREAPTVVDANPLMHPTRKLPSASGAIETPGLAALLALALLPAALYVFASRNPQGRW